MGAHNFEDQATGATAEEAFIKACEQAEYEYGHNAYNGTISTNNSFVMEYLEEGETIEEWKSRVWEDESFRKWGPCACVEDPDIAAEGGRLWHFAGWASC